MAGLTELTAEQRAAALEKAVEARRARSELKRKIKAGELGVEEALAAPEALLGLSMPGFDTRAIEHETLYSRLYMS